MFITVKTKTNGYKAEKLQKMISLFEKAAENLFPGCTVEHFYYGDHCDMVDLLISDSHHYASFNIYENRISLCGYTCSNEELVEFESMTYRDECYSGKLLQITETKERHFNLQKVSEYSFRATNIPHIVLKARKVGCAYTGEIVTKAECNMIYMLGVYNEITDLVKDADEFISNYHTMIDRILKEEK